MMDTQTPPWTVDFTGQSRKQKENLPDDIRELLSLLTWALQWKGPERTEWPHYGQIRGKGKKQDYRHCHLNQNRPVYVVIWKVTDMEHGVMEIRYVGPHENADYRRIN
jgi:hypothetical protein